MGTESGNAETAKPLPKVARAVPLSRPYRDRAEIQTAHSSKLLGAFVKAIFVIALSVRPMIWFAA
jgi:hypothetical protein